jgi:(p)ppGpp synthase/HD superfamily hydrolase
MHGYSDRINHAFAFAAKYYNVLAPAGAGVDYLAHPANVAIILARYGCEQVTIVAGILHHVLEESPPDHWPVLEQKISEKFGPVALAVAKDAIEPKFDRRGMERQWQPCKQEYLTQLAIAEPRAVDIIVADELHACGAIGADHLVVPFAARDPHRPVRLAAARDAVGAPVDERGHGAKPATE